MSEIDSDILPKWTLIGSVKWLMGITGVFSLIPWLSSRLANNEMLAQGVAALITILAASVLCAWIVWRRSTISKDNKSPFKPLYWKPSGTGRRETINLIVMATGSCIFATSLAYIISSNIAPFYQSIKSRLCMFGRTIVEKLASGVIDAEVVLPGIALLIVLIIVLVIGAYFLPMESK